MNKVSISSRISTPFIQDKHPINAVIPCHRLDNTAGSGLHLTPTGLEFDEKLVRFSSNLSARAAIGFTFPRSLPIDRDDDNFGFKIHRLSLKSLW